MTALACRLPFSTLLGLVALAATPAVMASVHSAHRGADTYHSTWEFREEDRRCRLVHQVPRFGKVVFDQRGDSPLLLQLQSELPLADSAITVQATAPVWRPDLTGFPITDFPGPSETHSVTITGKDAERAYQAMQDGYHLSAELGVVEGTLGLTANVTEFGLRAHGFHDCQTRASAAERERRANLAAEAAAKAAAAAALAIPIAPPTAALKQDVQPAPAVKLIQEAIFNTTDADRVFFAPGDASLSREATELLARHVALWQAGPRPVRVNLHGHADGVGTPHDNLMLSKRRAEAVARYLRGAVKGLRVVVHPHGEALPLVLAAGEHRRNRRVEIIPEGRAEWQ
ncbi:MAG: OmpA family protein [Pseudomonadota bacterium]